MPLLATASWRFGTKRIAIVILLLLSCFSLGGCPAQAEVPERQTFELAGESFELDLALTRQQIRRGMMGREDVGSHEGMLFVFPDVEVRSFWMKNCLVPLDVVFLDGGGRIVSIRTMPVPEDPDDPDPPSYSSIYPAQFAVELAAGRADELGLERGERVGLPLERLKRLARCVD